VATRQELTALDGDDMLRRLACILLALLLGCRDNQPVAPPSKETSTVQSNAKDSGKNKDGKQEYDTLFASAVEELKLKTAAHQATWHLGEEGNWSVDQDEGKLVFTFKKGVTATAPVQIIGSFNSKDKTWLWGWANSSVNDSLKTDALKVKEYGEQHQISKLTARKWSGTEDDAWAMAALAVKLCGSQGAYRGPAGDTKVFMTFGEVQLQKAQ
jgi:hypothetical protein